jgi:dihydrofolate reductase
MLRPEALVCRATIAGRSITQLTKLADEIRLSVIPIILGDGILFFDQIGQELALHLKEVTAYKSGMVELCYELRNE